MKKLLTLEDGVEQKPDDLEIDDDKIVEKARSGRGFLLDDVSPGSAAKHVRQRYDRMDPQMRLIQNELRVNWMRYKGHAFAQVHPSDSSRVFIPSNAKTRVPPSINRIRRMVHRYVSQVTADEPVIEGVPSTHTDEARDGALAATQSLSGEWQRMNLQRSLQRVQEVAAVMRSGYWLFEWDPTSGGKVAAQKFFKDELGQQILHYVDSSGNKVEDATEAAKVWAGNITCDVLMPMNVRWSGGNSLRDADEVFVAKVVTLGQLYEMHPDAREAKIKDLTGNVTPAMEDWMHEARGAGGIAGRNAALDDEEFEKTGEAVTDTSSLLDESVLLINYYRKPSRAYPQGLHVLIAGEYLVYRGGLRYGTYPVVQFRCLDDLQDPLGLSLVDLLKDPQELLDFVNGQILRFLQSMKRRWFVPLTSGINSRDLLNPTRSIIHYNSNSGPPIPEDVPNIPSSLTDWVTRFDDSFDDEAGIHDTMQGKHVPGVSSGRHAEALRQGDETILGLTRTQIKEGLEDSGEIMLAIMQKEWKTERKVRFFNGRHYIEKAFSNTNFRDTADVQLKRGTLLMLTQAQKLETLYHYTEMGALSVQELRKLAPLVDTAGISTTEDPHYIRARRENDAFLMGPNDKLVKARKRFDDMMKLLAEEVENSNNQAMAGGDIERQSLQIVSDRVTMLQGQATEAWNESFEKYMPTLEPWEKIPLISQVHFEEHSAVLASEKAKSLPDWWVEMFTQHTVQHMEVILPPPEDPEGVPGAVPVEEPVPEG